MAYQEQSVSREEAQTALGRILIERIRQDRYPSRTHMQIAEGIMPPSLYRDYLNALLEKVIGDAHPSITMLRQISQVIGRL